MSPERLPVRRRLAGIVQVVRYALGPAVRHTARVFRWWPTVVSVAAFAAPVAVYVLGRPTPWLVAGALAVVAALFLRAAMHFYRQAHPEFPRHVLNLKPLWHTELPDITQTKVRVLHLPVEFINREPNQPVILQFDVMSRRDDMPAYPLSYFTGRTLRDTLPSPVKVAPQDRIEGYVAFEGEFAIALEFGDEMDDVLVSDRFSVFLRVTDKLTGATIERPIPERRS